METQIVYRPDHEQHMTDPSDTGRRIYTDHFSQQTRLYNRLVELLDSVADGVIMRPSDSSWYDYQVVILYRGHEITVKDDWGNRKGLYFWTDEPTDSRKYGYLKYNVDEPNRTHRETATTKKVQAWLDWVVNRYDWLVSQTSDRNGELAAKVADVRALLGRLAARFGVTVQESTYRDTTEIYIEIPTQGGRNIRTGYEVTTYVKAISYHVSPDTLDEIINAMKN